MSQSDQYAVAVLPAGPEDARPAETLLRGDLDACVARYQELRGEGPLEYEGRALAVLDPAGRPVYAA